MVGFLNLYTEGLCVSINTLFVYKHNLKHPVNVDMQKRFKTNASKDSRNSLTVCNLINCKQLPICITKPQNTKILLQSTIAVFNNTKQLISTNYYQSKSKCLVIISTRSAWESICTRNVDRCNNTKAYNHHTLSEVSLYPWISIGLL